MQIEYVETQAHSLPHRVTDAPPLPTLPPADHVAPCAMRPAVANHIGACGDQQLLNQSLHQQVLVQPPPVSGRGRFKPR